MLSFAVIYGALVTLLVYSEGSYRHTTRSLNDEISAIVKAVCFATLILVPAIRLLSSSHLLPFLITNASLSIAVLLLVRTCTERMRGMEVRSGRGVRNVLIVGGRSNAREIAQYFATKLEYRRVVKGFLDEHAPLRDPVLGRIGDLPLIAQAEFIDEVILMPGLEHEATRVTHLARQHGIDVLLVPDLVGCEPEKMELDWLGRIPVIALHKRRLPEFALFIKRCLDVLVSVLFLVLLFPLLAVIALLIKFDSPGPLLYRALRVGRKGRRFCCYKFRTMVTDADQRKHNLRVLNQREGPFFKIAADPRVTRAGRFLRRYSIDELPQLWNVLRGDMSLVGPRPHPVDDVARYELDHLRRLDVTPGLTGLWQVSARQDPSFITNLALDVKYIQEWSLWLDLRILCKTFSAVLAGTGV